MAVSLRVRGQSCKGDRENILVLFCMAQVCVDKFIKAISTKYPIIIKKTSSVGSLTSRYLLFLKSSKL